MLTGFQIYKYANSVAAVRLVGLPAIPDAGIRYYMIPVVVEDPEKKSFRLIPLTETPENDAVFLGVN